MLVHPRVEVGVGRGRGRERDRQRHSLLGSSQPFRLSQLRPQTSLPSRYEPSAMCCPYISGPQNHKIW